MVHLHSIFYFTKLKLCTENYQRIFHILRQVELILNAFFANIRWCGQQTDKKFSPTVDQFTTPRHIVCVKEEVRYSDR